MNTNMIILDDATHSSTINDLAKTGLIKPVEFTVDGVVYMANSVWAATKWLTKNHKYDLDDNGRAIHNIQ